MSIQIQDDVTAELVTRLATLRGISQEAAVRVAVLAELERSAAPVPLRDRFAVLRAAFPLPRATGKLADKAFFDDLSGDR